MDTFSDENTFTLNDKVNRHNCRYGADDNPYWVQEVHTQHSQKENVWVRRLVIVLKFFNGNIK